MGWATVPTYKATINIRRLFEGGSDTPSDMQHALDALATCKRALRYADRREVVGTDDARVYRNSSLRGRATFVGWVLTQNCALLRGI